MCAFISTSIIIKHLHDSPWTWLLEVFNEVTINRVVTWTQHVEDGWEILVEVQPLESRVSKQNCMLLVAATSHNWVSLDEALVKLYYFHITVNYSLQAVASLRIDHRLVYFEIRLGKNYFVFRRVKKLEHWVIRVSSFQNFDDGQVLNRDRRSSKNKFQKVVFAFIICQKLQIYLHLDIVFFKLLCFKPRIMKTSRSRSYWSCANNDRFLFFLQFLNFVWFIRIRY